MSGVFVIEAMAAGLLFGLIVGTLVGYRDKRRGREAVWAVRTWLIRFRPAFDGFRAMHPFCDRCDGELFELEAKLDEWNKVSAAVEHAT